MIPMQRSLFVILLSIICGVSAAIGVNQLTPRPEKSKPETRPVYVAATSIRRGAKVAESDVKSVDWPVDLVPNGVVTQAEDVIGRAALTSITTNEPLMKSKFSESVGSGFASHSIPAGMRACSIQTSGPSASVAGFVRPGDKVDVLLNLRGSSRDETGGGSTITLLQSAEILAIDDIMDFDGATIKMWMKEGVSSVTLLVTPEQALQLSLGQAVGTVSLALRNGDDRAFLTDTRPVTINQIRNMPAVDTYALQTLLKDLGAVGLADSTSGSEDDKSTESDVSPRDSTAMASGAVNAEDERAGDVLAPSDTVRGVARSSTSRPRTENANAEFPGQSYILTLRGNQSGVVRVLGVENPVP
jgi:pilus assembly protein CpaB